MLPLTTLAAGPVVKRVEPQGASIWLALHEPAEVLVLVTNPGGEVVLRGAATTSQIGEHLHIVVVTTRGNSVLDWGQTYEYEIFVNDEPIDVTELLYEVGPRKLSFTLPGADLASTHVLHGSCRHPTNRGPDALVLLDTLIESALQGRRARPQLFVCSGDFVYADSPSASLLALVGQVGDDLLGPRKMLPEVALARRASPEERAGHAEQVAGIYAGPARQLFGFGEYLALHLLALSPCLWPHEVPDDLRGFRDALPQVRRALANCSFYAIFDDHEITDDWNLTRGWSERVLGTKLGRRMIANGLASFAVIHGWGNNPKQFSEGATGGRVLAHLASGEEPDSAFESDLGMPRTVGETLSPAADALTWHIRLQTPAIDLRALDTRTMRAFPGEDEHGLPDLMSEKAISEQLSGFSALPVLVVPSPFAPPPRTRAERWTVRMLRLVRGDSALVQRVYGPDRGDDWQPKSECFGRILDALGEKWVCLGGDTHLAYAAEVVATSGRGGVFCSSGMKRETTMRLLRQRIGFSFPWPWPRNPIIQTSTLAMRYLTSEQTQDGKRYQYLTRNNIGELTFEDRDDGQWATHALWCAGDDTAPRAVRHEVMLAT